MDQNRAVNLERGRLAHHQLMRRSIRFAYAVSGAYASPNVMQFLKFQRAISSFQWKTINWRAASALLIFLLSWISVPASMLAQHQAEEFCSMECCVADGHCCCAAAKPFVEGKDYSDVPKLALPELASKCPCPVTPPSTYKVAYSQIARTHSRHLAVIEPSLPSYRLEEKFYRSPQFSPNSSRAPPSTRF